MGNHTACEMQIRQSVRVVSLFPCAFGWVEKWSVVHTFFLKSKNHQEAEKKKESTS
jgi:hypothetical protein